MAANVGSTDKAARVLLGLCLLAFYFLAGGWVGLLGLLGILPLVTGILGYCPLYALLWRSTCRR